MNQELSLVPELSVEDNIFLGGIDVPLLYRRRRLSDHARRVLDQLGLGHVQLGTAVESLSIGERQLVEIARLLVRDARLLILDEPTATLSKPEIERVFRATRELVAQGRSVIFVSHRLDEVFELCDRVTVLRDGMRVGTHEIHEIDRRSLIEPHARRDGRGEDAGGARARRCPGRATEVVRIDRLHVPGSVEELSLTLESGIITGLAGQVGSGTSTVLRALGGLVPNASGTDRGPRPACAPQHATAGGRGGRPLHPERPAARGPLPRADGRAQPDRHAAPAAESARRPPARAVSSEPLGSSRPWQGVPLDRLGSPAASLSGGNQQKVLLGRALQLEGTALLALDEPTRGVDVGGRADIHDLVRAAAREGTAVIFSSTELDEVLDLADVVVTIFAGRIVSIVPRAQASASAILADMTTTHTAHGGAGS